MVYSFTFLHDYAILVPMKVDGRQIAAKIYDELKNRVGELKKNGITPHLTVILIGKDPASVTYVNQKQKWGKYIGAKITVLRFPESISSEELTKKIQDLNSNPDNHAILIQRPVPEQIDTKTLALLVNPEKDVDGFHPNSPYTLPLPLAVVKILEEIYQMKPMQGVASVGSGLSEAKELACERCETGEDKSKRQDPVIENFHSWLNSQNIVILGKGATAGGPILKYLTKLGIHPTQIDSKTPSPDELIKKAGIVISAVGKPDTITPKKIKKDAILIGVGIFREEDKKLHGDYKEGDIKNIAGFYTPTPGGVGPVNVAMLLQNLLDTTSKQTKNSN